MTAAELVTLDWFQLVTVLRPKLAVELGTGDGATAARIMIALPHDARFYTVNWPNPPSGDNPRRYLDPWWDDPRLHVVSGDTREVFDAIPDGIDLLYIDSTHTFECISAEWALYEPKLLYGAVVVCDDINDSDMRDFWDPLPYDKADFWQTAGLFIWRR